MGEELGVYVADGDGGGGVVEVVLGFDEVQSLVGGRSWMAPAGRKVPLFSGDWK